MLFAASIRYCDDRKKIAEIRPIHREYLRELLKYGRLAISGPYTDDSGALIIYSAESHEEALSLLKNDPFHEHGIFVSYELKPWKPVMANPELLPKGP